MNHPANVVVWIDCVSCDAGWPLATAWPKEVAGGVSLLAHAIDIARGVCAEFSGGENSSIGVLAPSRECALEAKRLGVRAVVSSDAGSAAKPFEQAVSAFPMWPAEIPLAPNTCHVIIHLRAPLLDPREVAALARLAMESQGEAHVVGGVARHPVAAFVPKQGRMDFSATMDGPKWRELEEARVVHCPDVARARWVGPSGSVGARETLLLGDEVSCFRILSDADLFVATRMLADAKALASGRRPWRKL